MKFKYITNRILRNKSGIEKGNIKVLVRVDSDQAEVDYVCPECLHKEHIEKEWKRPFSVTCSKCKFIIRLSRLKDEIKRERKLG